MVIRSEMAHEQRIIRLNGRVDGRPHVGKAIKTYMGNSVGHWEGHTLVVETTNLRPESGSGGRYTDAAKVTERFTRVAPDELRSCHEGNYMILGSLGAARQLEAQGLETKVERGPAGGPLPGRR